MQSFSDFGRAHGVIIEYANPDGRIHRVPTVDHPRKRNGAYMLRPDGRGWIQAHDMMTGVVWWNDPTAKPWTDDEKQAWAVKAKAKARQIEVKQQDARRRAQAMIVAAKPMQHGYLRLKGFPDAKGLVYLDAGAETLLVPMRDVQSNELWGVQRITWDADQRVWEKRFLHGQRTKGCVFRMGPPKAQGIILCEGYATGLSIQAAAELAKMPVQILVCFSADSLAAIGAASKGDVRVCADNDASGTGERVAKMTGKPWIMPDKIGEDWNDVHSTSGIYSVAAALAKLRNMPS